MIKGGLSGKLLKQSFIILLISCFILLGNSSVKAFTCDGNNNCYDLDFGEYISGNSGQYVGTVSDNAFNFSSKYFSYTTLRSNNLENKLNYWWESDGLHYTRKYWNESSPVNGKIVGFYVCSQRPYMQTAYRTLSNANFCTYKPSFLELKSYLNGVNKYSISCNSSNTYTNCMVCLYEYGVGNYICVDDGDTSNNESEFMGVSQIELVATNNPFVSTTPYLPTDSIGTGSVDSVQISGDYLVQQCTYQDILDYLESSGMNKYMCYGGLDNFDLYDSSLTYNPIPGTGKSLQEIVSYSSNWDSPLQWYNFWDGLRGGYTDMRESYPAVYKTWFDILYQYGGDVFDFNILLDYCNFSKLDFDKTQVYYGTRLRNVCTYGVHNPNNNDNDGAVGTNRNGVGGKTGQKTYTDGITFIQDGFQKLKENIPTNYDIGLGVLPAYIISFLGLLVLFRFISH